MPRKKPQEQLEEQPMPETIEEVASEERPAEATPVGEDPGADQTPPKRRKRRSSQAPAADASKYLKNLGKSLGVAAKVPFALVARRTGDDTWNLLEEEAQAIGEAFDFWITLRAPMLLPYLPEVVVVGALAGAIIPRVLLARSKAEQAVLEGNGHAAQAS